MYGISHMYKKNNVPELLKKFKIFRLLFSLLKAPVLKISKQIHKVYYYTGPFIGLRNNTQEIIHKILTNKFPHFSKNHKKISKLVFLIKNRFENNHTKYKILKDKHLRIPPLILPIISSKYYKTY